MKTPTESWVLVMQSQLQTVLACVAISCAGCARYRYHDVVLTVRDSDTQEPVADAELSIMYKAMFILNPPEATGGKTDSAGQLQVRLATIASGFSWMVQADGYQMNVGFGYPADPAKSYTSLVIQVADGAHHTIDLVKLDAATHR